MATYSVQPDPTEGVDAHVRSAFPTNNYGTHTALYVGKHNDVNILIARTFIKFDLTSIPSGSEISSATFSMYHYAHAANQTSDTVYVYRIDASWTEGGVTYNTSPAVNELMGSLTYNPQDTGNWREWALDASVLEDMLGVSPTKPNYGWRVLGATGNYYGHGFYSSDYTGDTSKRPKLEIVYTPATITVTPGAGSFGLGVGGPVFNRPAPVRVVLGAVNPSVDLAYPILLEMGGDKRSIVLPKKDMTLEMGADKRELVFPEE